MFDTGTRPNLVRKSFLPLKSHGCMSPVHKMSLKSVSESPALVIDTVVLLVQLGPTRACPVWCCGQNCRSATRWDIALSQILQEDSPNGKLHRLHTVLCSPPVSFTSKYTPLSDLLAELKNDSDTERDLNDHLDNRDRTLLS